MASGDASPALVAIDVESEKGRPDIAAKVDAVDAEEPVEQPDRFGLLKVLGGVLGLFACLYVFLIGLGLMGDAFKCLGGRGAGEMFKAINDPITGLMVGILATVLVQSSSTSTSIVVGLCAAEQISVNSAIPVVMGANIGTSVTNTIVSMGQIGNRIDLERSFAGATVHDMFNMVSVLVLLPLEIITHAIQGEGGLLYWISQGIVEKAMGGSKASKIFESPIKAITKPVTTAFIHNDKYLIHALSLGQPGVINLATDDRVNTTACQPRRLDALMEEDASDTSRALLNRRLSQVDCFHYYCVDHGLDKEFKKISKTSYKSLTPCDGYILSPTSDLCSRSSDVCYLNANDFWDQNVAQGRIISGGFVEGAGDVGGGLIALSLSLAFLVGGLFFLCKLLHIMLMTRAKRAIAQATKLNDYMAMLVGVGITIVVQSSSVVTSALTPLCGLGILPLHKMLPLTLGANIGTTVTALIAALATLEFHALQIAMCHLWFNILGICIWFPVPIMRKVPIGAARLLGLYASYYRFVPALYILVAFGIVPGIALAISVLLHASLAGGIVVLLLVLVTFGAFEFWWIRMGGCYRVLSKEQREEGARELERANCAMQCTAVDTDCPTGPEVAQQAGTDHGLVAV